MNSVGNRIRDKRLSLNYTQDRLATAAGISKGFLSDVETGTRSPSAEYLLKIGNALGVSLDYLMKGSSGAHSNPATEKVRFPTSLSNFALEHKLPFDVVVSMLEAKMRIVANRRDTVDNDLENFDWEGFYRAIKEYL
ncbi:MAG: helix-turn-helix transcriptional regulator [Verrucomicrobiales bacterium]|nr:helix-turn-helix transcriptional regulator [Verrucomicrobiales bacterium]